MSTYYQSSSPTRIHIPERQDLDLQPELSMLTDEQIKQMAFNFVERTTEPYLIGIVSPRRGGKTTTVEVIRALRPAFAEKEQFLVIPPYSCIKPCSPPYSIASIRVLGPMHRYIISDVREKEQLQAIIERKGIIIAIRQPGDGAPAFLEGLEPKESIIEIDFRPDVEDYRRELRARLASYGIA